MIICEHCRKRIALEEKRILHSQALCEDSYIKSIRPKKGKAYNKNNPARFMQRLKETYSVIRQKID